MKAQLEWEEKKAVQQQKPLQQKKKRLLLGFRKIIGYFVDYAQGYRWQREDVLDFFERIDNLRERITGFATDQGVDPEEPETVSVLTDPFLPIFSYRSFLTHL